MPVRPESVGALLRVVAEARLTPRAWREVDAALSGLANAHARHDDRGVRSAMDDLKDTLGGRRLMQGLNPRLGADEAGRAAGPGTLDVINQLQHTLGLPEPTAQSESATRSADPPGGLGEQP